MLSGTTTAIAEVECTFSLNIGYNTTTYYFIYKSCVSYTSGMREYSYQSMYEHHATWN